jgi:hypothetical protein
MKALLTVILLVAMLAMTTEGLLGGAMAMKSCARPPHGCCGHSDKAPPGPAGPLCQQCCMACGAILPPSLVEMQIPPGEPTEFCGANFGWVSRDEQPPVPPPRVS